MVPVGRTMIQNEINVLSVGVLLCRDGELLIATRSMARITRSQKSNMVECESATSRVGIDMINELFKSINQSINIIE